MIIAENNYKQIEAEINCTLQETGDLTIFHSFGWMVCDRCEIVEENGFTVYGYLKDIQVGSICTELGKLVYKNDDMEPWINFVL
jgi:hypothetical protein